MSRFWIVSEKHGLVATADTQERAERIALIAAVNTARTVHLHDRLTEGHNPSCPAVWPVLPGVYPCTCDLTGGQS